ncbi:hypothetical protein [Polaromonas jejuensis]|uniref:Uncharacterized protein n=1 Tax=Polaromonas jejuensis TaxID=457502 RepID=A0ABW0QB67_9BURK|nr:hypothetical protein [Polaromonas jejuensis]
MRWPTVSRAFTDPGSEILVEHGRPTRGHMESVCVEAEAAARELWGNEGRHDWR